MYSIIRQQWYLILFTLVVLIGGLLRFWNAYDRVGPYSDSARDVLVAQSAVDTRNFILTGSFSSAGPFVFGPLYYWYLMLVYFLFPNWAWAPWYILGFLSTVEIILLGKAAEIIKGKLAGIVTGVLVAVSPAAIFRSFGLTQHSFVGLSTSTAIWAFVNYWKNGSWQWVLVTGLFIGIALNMHYQCLGLLMMGWLIVMKKWKKWRQLLRDMLLFTLGFIIPQTPLFIWDSWQGWANMKNLLDYLLIGQYRVFISRRWLTFISEFFPKLWGESVGGSVITGWTAILATLLTCLFVLRKKKLSGLVLGLGSILLFQLIIVRYSHAELFEGYLLGLRPFILLLTGLSLTLYNQSFIKWWLAGLFFWFVIAGFIVSFAMVRKPGNEFLLFQLQKVVNEVKSRHGDKGVRIVDPGYMTTGLAYGLSLALKNANLINDNGPLVGVCWIDCFDSNEESLIGSLKLHKQEIGVFDLSRANYEEGTWKGVNPKQVMEEVGFWWREKPLASTFSLTAYLSEKFGFRR